LREIVRRLDGNLPISGVRTMEALYQMRAIRIFRVLIAVIGAMGLMGLAMIGLYQTDIISLLLVVPVVLAVTFVAAYVPARQASRVDPIPRAPE
jgi:ABC-type antimicrobial peptide transport system permease subunit